MTAIDKAFDNSAKLIWRQSLSLQTTTMTASSKRYIVKKNGLKMIA